MTIKEFVEIVKKGTNQRLAVVLETKKYLPMSEKRELAASVLDACSKYENGYLKIDSLNKYLIFTITIISKYTNLEFGVDSDSLADYDLLCEYGLLNVVIETFETEYKATNDVLNMMQSDLERQNSVEASIASLSRGIMDSLDKIIESLSQKIDEFNFNADEIDPDALSKLSALLNK